MRTTPSATRRLCQLSAGLALAAGATACNGSGGSATGTPSPAPSTATSSPAPPSTPSAAKRSSTSPAVTTQTPVPVESNPPGDIPDNLAFVKYASRAGGYLFMHPEGWARTSSGARVRFTDKLNGVTVERLSVTAAPTTATARRDDVARLRSTVPAFELRSVSAVALPAGRGVHIVFRRNSAPDAVTGKIFRDEVEEYAVFRKGRLVRMDLYGPVGADNVDAYRTMSQSLRIR